MHLGELHIQMCAAVVPIEHWDQFLGVDEFDAVITLEMALLVVKLVGIADWMILFGIDDERPLTIREFFV